MAIDAVFMATSGITDESLIDLITSAEAIAKPATNAQQKRHFSKGDTVVTVQWQLGETDCVITQRVGGEVAAQKVYELSTPKAARDKYAQLPAVFAARGFTEL